MRSWAGNDKDRRIARAPVSAMAGLLPMMALPARKASRGAALLLLGMCMSVLVLLGEVALSSSSLTGSQARAPPGDTLRRSSRAKPRWRPSPDHWTLPISCDVETQRLADTAVASMLPVDPHSVVVAAIFGGNAGGNRGNTDRGSLDTLRPVSAANKVAYAKRHGYRYVEVTATSQSAVPHISEPGLTLSRDWAKRNFMWGKLELVVNIFDQMKGVEYVFWSDADIIFTNMAVDLGLFIAQNKSLVTGGDYNGLNTGVFLVRNNAWARKLIKRATLVYPGPWPGWPGEQGSIIAVTHSLQVERQSFRVYNKWIQDWIRGKARHTHQAGVDEHMARLLKVAELRPLQLEKNLLMLPLCLSCSSTRSWVKGNFNVHFAGLPLWEKQAFAERFVQFQVTYDDSMLRKAKLANGKELVLPVQATEGVLFARE